MKIKITNFLTGNKKDLSRVDVQMSYGWRRYSVVYSNLYNEGGWLETSQLTMQHLHDIAYRVVDLTEDGIMMRVIKDE